jgi:hypothetical protein
LYYSKKLANSTNKPKTTWSIIKTITNNKKNFNNILMAEIDGKIMTHYQTIAEKLNNYYVSVAASITNNNPVNNNNDDLNKINQLNYLCSVFKQSFTSIKMKNTATYEIKEIEGLKSKMSCGYDEITMKIFIW